MQEKLKTLVAGGDLSIFTNGWFGHPAYSQDMPAELHLIAVAHYLEALEMQAEASRVIAIMGGKFPHFMTSIPGGTAWMPTEEKLDDILFRLIRVKDWVMNTMIPDTLAIAPFYTDALSYGAGTGNFLAWGVFNDESMEMTKRYLPNGIVTVPTSGLTVTDADPAKIAEYVTHSWLDGENGLNPAEGETVPPVEFAGYDVNKRYTWAKAPRYDGKSCEVGPLSRMIVAYLRGVPEVKAIIDLALAKLGAAGKPEVLVSLLGRIAARNLETAVVAGLGHRLDQRARRCRQGRRRGVLQADRGRPGTGRWHVGGAARRSRPLDERPGRAHRQLPDRHPVDVGHQPSRREGRPRSDGGGPRRALRSWIPRSPWRPCRVARSFDP